MFLESSNLRAITVPLSKYAVGSDAGEVNKGVIIVSLATPMSMSLYLCLEELRIFNTIAFLPKGTLSSVEMFMC